MTDPAEIEATADTVEVVYNGKTYTMPAALDDASAETLEAIDGQKLSFAIRELLGDQQYRTFKATKPKVRDFAALFNAYAEHIGLGSLEN